MPKTDSKSAPNDNSEIITCYVLGNTVELPYGKAPSQLDVERAFPTGKMLPVFMDKAEVDARNITGNVHISNFGKVQPVFLIQVNRCNLNLRVEQESPLRQAVNQIDKKAVYVTDDHVTRVRATSGEASQQIYVKRSNVLIIASAYINATTQTSYDDYPIELIVAFGPGPSPINFPGAEFIVNKSPLQIGLSKSVRPYVDAWNTTTGDCRLKTCAVFFKYKSGHNRSHLQPAGAMQATIADAKSDAPSVYEFFRHMFETIQKSKEIPWASLQDGDFGAALCTVDTMFTEAAVCFDYLLAVGFLKDIGKLIIEFANYGCDEKFQPLARVVAKTNDVSDRSTVAVQPAASAGAVATIALLPVGLGGAAAEWQQSANTNAISLDLSTPSPG